MSFQRLQIVYQKLQHGVRKNNFQLYKIRHRTATLLS